MKYLLPRWYALTLVIGLMPAASILAADYQVVPDWLRLPDDGRETLGAMHGDVEVSAAGDIYVSTETDRAGIMVFNQSGEFLRSLRVPGDFHGFKIHRDADGEFIYAAGLFSQALFKINLDGAIVMTIGTAQIPDKYRIGNQLTPTPVFLFSDIDVAPNGDIYVSDGYAADYIHRFDKHGNYLSSFGGREAPYNFTMLHKIAMDTRFDPVRIIATDRRNNKIVHISLEGEYLGVIAEDLKDPAALAISGDLVLVAEYMGRVSVLDRDGRMVARISENVGEGVGTPTLPPEKWRNGIVVTPHGVAGNAAGDVFITEHSNFGRVHRFNRL